MRQLNFKVICCMLLASILCTGAAGRRRSSSPRPGSIHRPNFGSRHRPTLPSLIRTVSTTTFKPNRRFRPTSNRFNFNSIPPNPSDLTQREGENKISCRNAHEVLPDYKNPSYYKICIPIGRNWILYTYRCPTGSEFHPENLKCTKISTTTNTATTTVPTTISVDEITESAISNNGIDVGFHLNATETIDVLPEMSMETWDSSSSSEEEISTNSPTSTTAQTVPTPRAPASVEAKPLSQFVQSLFSQGSNQEMSDRFSILTKYLMTTVKPQQMSGHQNKISTDFMHETTSNIPLTTSSVATTGHLNQENESVVWESSGNQNEASTTRGSITRWKLPNLSPSQAGRFPGLRPSPLSSQ